MAQDDAPARQETEVRVPVHSAATRGAAALTRAPRPRRRSGKHARSATGNGKRSTLRRGARARQRSRKPYGRLPALTRATPARRRLQRDKGKAPADATPELKAAKGGLPPLGEGVRTPRSLAVTACGACGGAPTPHALCASPRAQENRLHRDTPFLCDFRFHTPLPPPPIGPKLLPVAVDRSRMTAYKPYNLWWERPHELPLEMSLGMSLDPLDVEAYRAPPVAPPLDPADEALLAPLDTGLPLSSGPGFRVGKHKGKNKAGWFMRTLYLSDMQLPKVRAPARGDLSSAGLLLRTCVLCARWARALRRRRVWR